MANIERGCASERARGKREKERGGGRGGGRESVSQSASVRERQILEKELYFRIHETQQVKKERKRKEGRKRTVVNPKAREPYNPRLGFQPRSFPELGAY